ncbi:hypothetical protein D3C81_1754000 [compost metagenome]
MVCSIFMASSTATVCPGLTISSSATATATTLPVSGARIATSPSLISSSGSPWCGVCACAGRTVPPSKASCARPACAMASAAAASSCTIASKCRVWTSCARKSSRCTSARSRLRLVGTPAMRNSARLRCRRRTAASNFGVALLTISLASKVSKLGDGS